MPCIHYRAKYDKAQLPCFECWVTLHAFLSSAAFHEDIPFQKNLFKNTECQTEWIQTKKSGSILFTKVISRSPAEQVIVRGDKVIFLNKLPHCIYLFFPFINHSLLHSSTF